MTTEEGFLGRRLEFPFPAREVHAGIPLSNGTFGTLIWGEGRRIRLTINRADYWDHRGGLSFGSDATYANLERWLRGGDEARLREVFEGRREEEGGVPPRPTRLPMGRIELELPEDWTIAGGGLHLHTGEAVLEVGPEESAEDQEARPGDLGRLRAAVLREKPVLCLRITGVGAGACRVTGRPPDAPEVLDYFRRYGFPEATSFSDGEFGGWVQECPGEPALCVAWSFHANGVGLLLYVTAVFGAGPSEARWQAMQMLETVRGEGYTPATLRTFGSWRRWWEQAAAVRLPDPTLELLYYLGMYKLGGLSVPGGPAATLQGPWVEEHRLPPWSSDYHFNINVQECYWPCFAGNHVEVMEPLVEMLRQWEPRLRENARQFVGTADGLMLPHSTDDRGMAMSGFWTGFVDHGSTGWTGQLLWLQYRYTMDRGFLKSTVYPFLKGAMRVYEAMLRDDGTELSLPVSVSPEFGGSGFGAWGRNASFQLAVIHFLCRALLSASEELGIDAMDRPRWADIDARLPLAALGEGPELLLWEGQALTESHRHHSHLAGIYPFDVIDPRSEEHGALVRNSMRRLVRQGMGLWTGWCMPWAAILHARQGNGPMAVLLLELFRRVFMGPGYASTHDGRFAGFTAMDGRPDIMQVEAAEAAAAAVLELLVHTSSGVLRVFPAIPPDWPEASFQNIRAEGAFLVSGEWRRGKVRSINIGSEAGAPLRVANPWHPAPLAVIVAGGATVRRSGAVVQLETTPGQQLELKPA